MQLLKSMEEINEMSDDSEDVNSSNLITKYAQRPIYLESITLADFAAKHYKTASYSRNIGTKNIVDSDGFPLESDDIDNNQDNVRVECQSSDTKLKERKKPRVIRSVWFNIEIDEENHFRDLLMLFTSWRAESELLRFGSFRRGYQVCKNIIELQMKEYAVCQEALDKAVQSFEMNDEQDAWDILAPTTQHTERQDSADII